jgi:hypothetical protein
MQILIDAYKSVGHAARENRPDAATADAATADAVLVSVTAAGQLVVDQATARRPPPGPAGEGTAAGARRP